MTVGVNEFNVFFDNFDNCPSRVWCICDIQIIGKESKFQIRYYSIRFTNAVYLYLLLAVFDACINNTESNNHKTD